LEVAGDLLAKELFPAGFDFTRWPSKSGFKLGYFCGPTNQPARLRGWVAANEADRYHNPNSMATTLFKLL
jgi:hypothetical protein